MVFSSTTAISGDTSLRRAAGIFSMEASTDRADGIGEFRSLLWVCLSAFLLSRLFLLGPLRLSTTASSCADSLSLSSLAPWRVVAVVPASCCSSVTIAAPSAIVADTSEVGVEVVIEILVSIPVYWNLVQISRRRSISSSAALLAATSSWSSPSAALLAATSSWSSPSAALLAAASSSRRCAASRRGWRTWAGGGGGQVPASMFLSMNSERLRNLLVLLLKCSLLIPLTFQT